MSARKECEEHIVPIKLYKSWYDRGMSVIYSGYCIKCGAYCECHNDEVRVGDGVKMEIANNVVFPDLQKLEENYMGHSFSLSYEDYEKIFNYWIRNN